MNRTMEYSIAGNPDGPTLVFIHGWPDDASLWRQQLAALAPDFRCVLLTLPNFGRTPEKAGGFDFPELVARMAATIREVHPGGPVGLETLAASIGEEKETIEDVIEPGNTRFRLIRALEMLSGKKASNPPECQAELPQA